MHEDALDAQCADGAGGLFVRVERDEAVASPGRDARFKVVAVGKWRKDAYEVLLRCERGDIANIHTGL